MSLNFQTYVVLLCQKNGDEKKNVKGHSTIHLLQVIYFYLQWDKVMAFSPSNSWLAGLIFFYYVQLLGM